MSSLCRSGSPMCGLQGHIQLLRQPTWLLEQRAEDADATHLAGTAGSVVGHHGASAKVSWYRYHHIPINWDEELLLYL